jgi:hypothetical protein
VPCLKICSSHRSPDETLASVVLLTLVWCLGEPLVEFTAVHEIPVIARSELAGERFEGRNLSAGVGDFLRTRRWVQTVVGNVGVQECGSRR